MNFSESLKKVNCEHDFDWLSVPPMNMDNVNLRCRKCDFTTHYSGSVAENYAASDPCHLRKNILNHDLGADRCRECNICSDEDSVIFIEQAKICVAAKKALMTATQMVKESKDLDERILKFRLERIAKRMEEEKEEKRWLKLYADARTERRQKLLNNRSEYDRLKKDSESSNRLRKVLFECFGLKKLIDVAACSHKTGHDWTYQYIDSEEHLECSICGELMNILNKSDHVYLSPSSKSSAKVMNQKSFRIAQGAHGVTFVPKEKKGLWGIVDFEKDEIVMPFDYDGIYQSHSMPEHLFIIVSGGKFGVYDIEKCDYFIRPIYDEVEHIPKCSSKNECSYFRVKVGDEIVNVKEDAELTWLKCHGVECRTLSQSMGKISACTSNKKFHSSRSTFDSKKHEEWQKDRNEREAYFKKHGRSATW